MYFYVNQTNYPHVSYPTMTDIPELECKDSTVRSAGCGLCSASMVVTNLTGKEFPLIDCLELSLAVNANHSPGTDMDRLAPYVAERFDLVYFPMAAIMWLWWGSTRIRSISPCWIPPRCRISTRKRAAPEK